MIEMKPKYRAWILGKMWEVRALDWKEDGIFITTDGGFMQLCEEDDVHLLEYIGRKDKNGVEIYQGDKLGGLIGGFVYWDEKETRFGIKFPDFPEETREVMFEELGQEDLEVIGNIYESRDLLEVK